MAEVDTSSYLKPSAGKSSIEVANELATLKQRGQSIERQGIGIEADKLALINTRFGLLAKQLVPLGDDPNVTPDKINGVYDNAVKLGLMDPDSAAKAKSLIPPKSTPEQLRQHIKDEIDRGKTMMEAINTHYGVPGLVGTPQGTYPVMQSPEFGTRPSGPMLPSGIPQTQLNAPTTITPESGQPETMPLQKFIESTGGNPASPQQFPTPQNPTGRLPIAPLAPAAPAQVAPAARSSIQGATPGTIEASKIVGSQSGQALAEEQAAARSYQREIFPLMAAIPALEKLGTKGTGPGTETINHIKSFVLSNVPGVKESDFNGTVADYDKAKKYLTDFVNQNGNTGTNDKLAAAFAGNPSVGISNAAAVDVAKSALSLRNMRQASLMEFRRTGLTADKFADWAAQWSNEHDPRAFGVNLLSKENAKKLHDELTKPGHERELKNFERSLAIAHQLGFIKLTGSE